MGYESKIYLALPSTWASDVHVHDQDNRWTPEVTGRKALSCQIVAMVDLSKAGDGPVSTVIRQGIDAEKDRLATQTEDGALVPGYGLYISGDEFADRDPYDDPVSPLNLDALIDALDVEYALSAYRRFGLARQVLRAWRDLLGDFGGPEHTVVLHYGH